MLAVVTTTSHIKSCWYLTLTRALQLQMVLPSSSCPPGPWLVEMWWRSFFIADATTSGLGRNSVVAPFVMISVLFHAWKETLSDLSPSRVIETHPILASLADVVVGVDTLELIKKRQWESASRLDFVANLGFDGWSGGFYVVSSSLSSSSEWIPVDGWSWNGWESRELDQRCKSKTQKCKQSVAVVLPQQQLQCNVLVFNIVNSSKFLAFGTKIRPSYMKSGTRNRLVTFKRSKKTQKYPNSQIFTFLLRELVLEWGGRHTNRVILGKNVVSGALCGHSAVTKRCEGILHFVIDGLWAMSPTNTEKATSQIAPFSRKFSSLATCQSTVEGSFAPKRVLRVY